MRIVHIATKFGPIPTHIRFELQQPNSVWYHVYGGGMFHQGQTRSTPTPNFAWQNKMRGNFIGWTVPPATQAIIFL